MISNMGIKRNECCMLFQNYWSYFNEKLFFLNIVILNIKIFVICIMGNKRYKILNTISLIKTF